MSNCSIQPNFGHKSDPKSSSNVTFGYVCDTEYISLFCFCFFVYQTLVVIVLILYFIFCMLFYMSLFFGKVLANFVLAMYANK